MSHNEGNTVGLGQRPPDGFLRGNAFEILPEALPDALRHLDDDLKGFIHVGLLGILYEN
jgi:hypothetical protein